MAIDFPSSPSNGTLYVSENGSIYVYDGSWTTKGDTQGTNPFQANPFKYRSIYTHGFVAGGYKDSTPWRNINKTSHPTDVTTNLGDLLDQAAAYTMGSYNDYSMFVYATATTWPGTGTYTSSFSMVTQTGRTHDTNWDLKSSAGNYGDVGVILNNNLTLAWILSDQTNIDKHNLATEIMLVSGSGGSAGTAGDYVCTWQGENYGWVKHSNSGNRNHKILFSTETWSAGGLTVGTDGWGKALSTKDGWAYVKNGGNTTASIYKVSDSTGSNLRTDLTAPDGAAGEENYETGQIHSYCLGHYNGAQNNNTYKVVHATDTLTTMGSTTQPKGHDGMSSAACASASVTFTGAI